MSRESLDFGDYVKIEQLRFGVPNERYLYKVIGRKQSNKYVTVPVRHGINEAVHADVVPVVACICCGVDETKVLNFRLEDVELAAGHQSTESA